MTVPVEHTWFLAKYVADDLRGETRNVGVILRAANAPPKIRLLSPVPFLREEHREEWKNWSDYWGPGGQTWFTHGNEKPFYWLTKPSPRNPHLRWELAGSRLATLVDFEQMFELLVLPENR